MFKLNDRVKLKSTGREGTVISIIGEYGNTPQHIIVLYDSPLTDCLKGTGNQGGYGSHIYWKKVED